MRRRNCWTQVDLAHRIGTDPLTISRWERGIARPRPSALSRFRELGGVLPRTLGALVRATGRDEAARLLKRAVLLTHPRSRTGPKTRALVYVM
ncbi:MAG: helix-turn-helix domain-containing protein [Actinomycetota bacterium]